MRHCGDLWIRQHDVARHFSRAVCVIPTANAIAASVKLLGSGTGLNPWMRMLYWSATHTFPEPSTAKLTGPLNWPFPLPAVPNCVMYEPLLENSWMRLFV